MLYQCYVCKNTIDNPTKNQKKTFRRTKGERIYCLSCSKAPKFIPKPKDDKVKIVKSDTVTRTIRIKRITIESIGRHINTNFPIKVSVNAWIDWAIRKALDE